MRPVVLTFPNPSYSAVSATQSITASAGGFAILNGSLAPVGNLTPSASTPTDASFYKPVVLKGIARPVTIFATSSATAVVFTVIGRDLYGNVITATITGASGGSSSATDAVATTNGVDFNIVTAVKLSASMGNFTIGTGATGVTNWVPLDQWKNPFNVGIAVVTATIAAVTIQDTPNSPGLIPNWPNTATAPTVFNHATLVSVTANQESNYAYSVQYVRAVVTTNTATGVGGSVITIGQSG